MLPQNGKFRARLCETAVLAKKQDFPIVRALDDLVLGQPFFVEFPTFLGRCVVNYYAPTSLPPSPVSFASSTQNAAPQQPTNQPTKDLTQDTCSKAHVDVPRSVAIPAVEPTAVLSNRQPNYFLTEIVLTLTISRRC